MSEMQQTVQQNNNDKHEKQRLAILYAIKRDPAINRTKLMKYVFFVDLFAYNKFGHTILEDEYKRLPNGPVPEYGFNYTTPNHLPGNNGKDFKMEKVIDGGYYYYKFTLSESSVPDLTHTFKPVEQDLLNLVLDMVQSHTANYLSDYTHNLALWKDHENSETISPFEFRLPPDEMEDLELLLHTKIYVDAEIPKWNIPKYRVNPQDKPDAGHSNNPPERLPEIVDAKTREVLNTK